MLENLLLKIFARRQLSILKKAALAIADLVKNGATAARIVAVVLLVAQAVGSVAFDTPVQAAGGAPELAGYELVFEDEFDDENFYNANWETRAAGRRAGGYISENQAKIKDGRLVLTAEYLENGEFGEGWYSGMVRTKEEFLYGYYEITCICSGGGGFWSAFWLNSRGMSSAEVSNGGLGGAEIDIMEAGNYSNRLGSDSVTVNVHVGGYGEGLSSMSLYSFYGKNVYSEMNTYGLLWTEDEYVFYINGKEALRTDFEKGTSKFWEYVIMSLELPKEVEHEKGFKTEYIIENVKIYQNEEIRQIQK